MTAIAPPAAARRAPLKALHARVGTSGMVAAGFLAFIVLVALLAPVVAPHDPEAQSLSIPFAGPSSDHLLGTDQIGRDLLSRLIWGARSSLLGPLVVVTIAVVVGVPLAITSAWRGGRVDALIGRLLDVMFAFPGVLLAILVVALFGPGLSACAVALGIAYIPWLARVARSAALRERAKPYIAAVEVQGVSGPAICARHLVPNIAHVIVAQATVSFGYALVDLAALSFLGLGVQPPQADWGVMVNSEDSILRGQPDQALYAGLLIVLCVTAITFLGNRITDEPLEGRG